MEKIMTERDVKVFEKEMKHVQIQEGLAKIEAVRKRQKEDPDSVELEQDTCGGKSLVLE